MIWICCLNYPAGTLAGATCKDWGAVTNASMDHWNAQWTLYSTVDRSCQQIRTSSSIFFSALRARQAQMLSNKYQVSTWALPESLALLLFLVGRGGSHCPSLIPGRPGNDCWHLRKLGKEFQLHSLLEVHDGCCISAFRQITDHQHFWARTICQAAPKQLAWSSIPWRNATKVQEGGSLITLQWRKPMA